jgi:hypothetical protein
MKAQGEWKEFRRGWRTASCVSTGFMLSVLALARTLWGDHGDDTEVVWIALFAIACSPAIVASSIAAMLDTRFRSQPAPGVAREHITGLSMLLFLGAVAAVAALANWAATAGAAREAISSEWGILTIALLAIVSCAVAASSNFYVFDFSSPLYEAVKRALAPLGRLASSADRVLVMVVAPAAGATERTILLRYGLLLSTMLPCAALAFYVDPPWGTIPLLWAFLVMMSMARRWAWVENDREVAMLNRRFVGDHLRIGFDQDLKDEALVSLLFVLLFVPLGLRQAQMAAHDAEVTLFNLSWNESTNLQVWIALFGTELAKAVPFVDWAEIYNIGGRSDHLVTSPLAHHLVFAVRVLVDLAFLATLLQAFSISERNARQRELFKAGVLDRLDPFIEPYAFRKLVRQSGDTWVRDNDALSAFPRYDPVRLGELSGPDQPPLLQQAAIALIEVQGGAESGHFHRELLKRTTGDRRDRRAILEAIRAIRAAGSRRQVQELDQARRSLNGDDRISDVREQVMELLIEAEGSGEKLSALRSVIEGPERDSLGTIRAMAFIPLVEATDFGDMELLRHIISYRESDSATPQEKAAAQKLFMMLGAPRSG